MIKQSALPQSMKKHDTSATESLVKEAVAGRETIGFAEGVWRSVKGFLVLRRNVQPSLRGKRERQNTEIERSRRQMFAHTKVDYESRLENKFAKSQSELAPRSHSGDCREEQLTRRF